MTDRQYVIRAAEMMKFDIIKPTREVRDILVYDWASGKGVCVVEALTWKAAREQINAYAAKRAARAVS